MNATVKLYKYDVQYYLIFDDDDDVYYYMRLRLKLEGERSSSQ